MPNQCIDGAFCRRVGRDCAHDGVRRERRDENDAASFRHDREELLHEKEGRPDIDCEELVEIFDGRFLDGCCSRDPCIGDQNVEAIADDAAGLLGKLVRAVSGGEICRYGVRTTTRLLYVSDNTIGFIRAAAVMDENLGAGRSERECAGAAHAAGSAGNKGGLA
jgi:hypothetical protein